MGHPHHFKIKLYRLVISPLSHSTMLKRMGASEAALACSIARRPRMRVGSTQSELTIEPSYPARWLSADVTGEVQAGSVSLPFALLPNLRWESLYFVTTKLLPSAVLSAMISHLLDPVIKATGHCLGTTASISAYPAEEFDLANTCFIELALASEHEYSPYEFVLGLTSDTALELVTNTITGSAQFDSWQNRMNICVRPILVLGQSLIPTSDLKNLCAGDIVLIDLLPAQLLNPDFRYDLIAGAHPFAHGPIRASSFELASFSHNMDTTETPSWGATFSTERSSVEYLTLSAQAVIAMDSIRVGDLAKWGVGSAIKLPHGVDSDQILLMVGGQRVARARLVTIGDRLGVELVELFLA
jgi:hypothetical protein